MAMKRFAFVVMLLALPARAGVTYQFESVSNGLNSATLSGVVSVEGSNVRMDVKSGDNLFFKDGSTVLSKDAGKTLSVFDPATKTYYVVHLDDLVSAGGLLNQGAGMFKLTFSNAKVAVTELGDGGTISGYPTKRARLVASYDIGVNAMGTTITSHMSMTTDSWTTDRLGPEFATFLQAKGLRTGNAEVDQLIAAQSGAIAGRFPLKQVTTLSVQQGNGGELSSSTTSTVTNVEKKTLPITAFTAPSGFTKVDDPVTRLIRTIGK